MLAFFRNLLGFALGLVLTASVLRAVDPRQPVPVERALASRDDCEVLIAGPSYINTGINTRFFDEESEAIGLNLHACKLAQGALFGFEYERALELAFEHDWPKLEYVVVDVTLGDGMNFQPENWFKPRTVEWHTWGAIPWLRRHYEERPGTWLDKAPAFRVHAEHLAMNYLGVGRGLSLLDRLRLFEGLDDGDQVVERRPADAEDDAAYVGAAYRAAVGRLTRDKARARAGTPGSDAWPLELRALVRAHGYDPIFVVSPVLYTKRPFRSSTLDDRLFVLDFQDPARYPELYREDVRGHTSHLKGAGVRIYSALLARRLLEMKAHHAGGRWRSP